MKIQFWTQWQGEPSIVSMDLYRQPEFNRHESHPTDEEYSFHAERYEIDGDRIIREVISGGRDCDGEIRYYSNSYCLISELQSGTTDADDPTIRYPRWIHTDSATYDEQAELAGY